MYEGVNVLNKKDKIKHKAVLIGSLIFWLGVAVAIRRINK